MEPIIVICCCHNSCCLPYIRSLAFLISEFLIVQQDSASAHRDVQPPQHSSRQICGRLTTVTTVQLTTTSGASASLDKSAQDVDDLRQRLIDVWTGIQQSVIYNAIEWHSRLHTCIQAIGGYFE